jgi:arylformamidase
VTLIDLSFPIEDGRLPFPSDPETRLVPHSTVAEGGCNVTRISMSSHLGTHVDAPYHIFDEGATVDRIPLDRFSGPAALADLAPGGALTPGAKIGVAMLEPHAAAFAPGGRTLLRTGWDRRAGTAAYFEDFPSLSVEAARWIAARGIVLLGTDTPSPAVSWEEVHRILLGPGAEIVLLEGLRGLERLPPRFTLMAFPLALAGRDGSPVRAVAAVELPPSL